MCVQIITDNEQNVKSTEGKEVSIFEGLRRFSKILVTGPQ